MHLTSMASLVTSSGGQPWVSVIILPSLLWTYLKVCANVQWATSGEATWNQ